MGAVSNSLGDLLALVNLGVIGVSAYVLYQVWRVIQEKKGSIPKEKMTSCLYAAMGMTVILMGMMAGVELAKFYGTISYNEKTVRDAALSQEVIQKAREIVSQAFFDPQLSDSGDGHYVGRAPNGLLLPVRKDPVFQDFSGDILVQRLWADPSQQDGLIRAWKPLGEHCLMMEFCRKGIGCDVTLKPKGNEAIDTTGFNKMVIRAKMEENSACKKPAAFRIRVIDGRGNHWSWGKLVSVGKHAYPAVMYSGIDANEKEMTLTNKTKDFVFDITSRNKWAAFPSDGSAAPLNAPSERFTCIQGVVIEPGLKLGKDASVDPAVSTDSASYLHDRYLARSPDKSTSVMSISRVWFE